MQEHLNVLNLMLSNERCRLARAKTSYEKELRKVWVNGIEKEIAGELVFLKENYPDFQIIEGIDENLSSDQLLTALGF